MDINEFRFVSIVRDSSYNLCALLTHGNRYQFREMKVNIISSIISSMEKILDNNNVKYKAKEFNDFIRKFRIIIVNKELFTKYCYLMIYEHMLEKLADEGIIVKRDVSDDFDSSAIQIIDIDSFNKFMACCDFSEFVEDSFLAHSTLFLQVFAIINKRTINVKLGGINYMINSEQIQEITA